MTMMLDPLDVSYSQVAVFDSSLKQPFSLWTEKHVSQGFAWRLGSASFRTIKEFGSHSLEVTVSDDDLEICADAQRVIEVPFVVPASGEIDVASISDSRALNIRPGSYVLRFECSSEANGTGNKIKFSFIKNKKSEFRLLRTDSGLANESDLLLTATPA